MAQTARFAIPQLSPGQLQKEYYHNEALQRIDMLLCPVVEGMPAESPPPDPPTGSCYLVGTAATGAWAGQDGALACFTEGGWRFVAPVEGISVIDRDSGLASAWRNGAWESGVARVSEVRVEGSVVVKKRQAAVQLPNGGSTIDQECRSAVVAILDRLRSHGLIS